jgi:type II secretory pathway pseudopilin PulG
MKLNLLKNKSKGFTLVEILLVVGFIALASTGVYIIYSKVQLGAQANAESRNLDTFRAGIKAMYGVTSSFSSPTPISNLVANNARITPDAMRVVGDANGIINSFGGVVNIAPVSLGTGTNNGFRITYPNVPGGVCVKLATTAGSQFDQVLVNAVIVKTFGTNALDPAAAAANCNAGDVGNGVQMVFDSL